jgi:DNA polymerase-3 subunit delta'
LIEDIERMSRGAVNALLKAMEEPLPGRKIIATTSNKESLIATILSRATLIPFVLVPDSDMRTIITSQ